MQSSKARIGDGCEARKACAYAFVSVVDLAVEES